MPGDPRNASNGVADAALEGSWSRFWGILLGHEVESPTVEPVGDFHWEGVCASVGNIGASEAVGILRQDLDSLL